MYFAELLEIAPKLSEYTNSMPQELDGKFRIKVFPPHTLIHQQESQLKEVGILLSGSFRVVSEIENGNVFMIEFNEAISFVGEVALLAREARTSVTIEAIEECVVAYLPAHLFDMWLDQDNHLLKKIAIHVAQKLYRSSHRRGERFFHSTKYILVSYLCDHYTGDNCTILKTRQAICEELGVTVKTLNRTITQLSRENLLTLLHGKITISQSQYLRLLKEKRENSKMSRNGYKG